MIYEPDLRIDDLEYLYRYQSITSLLHMEAEGGAFLRPRYWSIEGQASIFHQEYVDFYNNNKENLSIFSLSVWRSEKIALENYANGFESYKRRGGKDVILMRIPRKAEGMSKLKWIDDDLLPEKALLLYQIGPHDPDKVYGTVGIPWEQIEFCRTPWRPMLSREWEPPKEYILVDHPLAMNYKFRPFNHHFDESIVPVEEVQLRNILDQYEYFCLAKKRMSGIRRILQPISFMKSNNAVNSCKNLLSILIDVFPAFRAAAIRIISALDKEDEKKEILEEIIK